MRQMPQTTRRTVLTAAGTVSLLGLGGIATGSSSPVADAPIPADSDARTYPTMGNADAPTATVYGNFKCPYTQEFVLGNLEAIVDEFVETGRLAIQFYDLAYEPGDTSTHYISSSDPRISAFALGVWDEDPNSYWQFYVETFEDLPEGYVDYDELASRARSAGVSNVDQIVERTRAGAYDGAVERVATAAADDGVTFTPTLELAGETTAPHHDTQSILEWIEARLEDEPTETSGDGDEPTETSGDGDTAESDGTEDTDSDADSSEGVDESTDETSSGGGDGTATGDADVNESEPVASDEDEFEWVSEPEEPTATGETCP